MLRSMRRNTKIIMLVVAIAFVGLMVFEWGMDASGRSNTAAVGEVGRVNGTVVSYQYWTQTFRSLTDQARLQKGAPLNDLEIDYIEDQTWNQIVNQILIEQEIRRQGIAVTDEEVQLAFQTSPPPWLQQNELFQTGGQFDYAKYQAFFSGPAVDPTLLQQIEAYYRDVLPRARLFEALGSGIYISDSELWSIYRDRSEQVQVKYAVIDPETQVDDSEVSISEDELRGYYDAHRDDFHQPANALVTLVQIVRTPEAADTAAALEAANRIREQALEGADFEELARANSADRGSAESGGDLGWFGPNDMTPDFEAAAFAMEVDEISEPVLTLYGYHVIKMHEKEEDRVHASHVLIEIGLRGESEDNLLGRVDQLERIALTQGLDAAVDSVGLAGAQITLAEGSDFVPGLGPFGPVQHWAFHDSTLIGDLSPIYETDQGFAVFELAQLTPEGFISFEEAEPSVRTRLTLEKKQETARWRGEQIAAEIADGKPFDQAAADHGLAVQTSTVFSRLDFVPGLGQANPVIGTAFGLGLNESAGPIESDGRLFLIEVTARVDASRETFELGKEDMRAQLTIQRRQTAIDAWLADMRDQADIQDYRREFFTPRS